MHAQPGTLPTITRTSCLIVIRMVYGLFTRINAQAQVLNLLYAVKMSSKLLVVLLYFTTQEIFCQSQQLAQQKSCPQSTAISQRLDAKFFNALRKLASDGYTCKINASKLGPYQITESYYNEAVEFNPQLKNGGSYII